MFAGEAVKSFQLPMLGQADMTLTCPNTNSILPSARKNSSWLTSTKTAFAGEETDGTDVWNVGFRVMAYNQ